MKLVSLFGYVIIAGTAISVAPFLGQTSDADRAVYEQKAKPVFDAKCKMCHEFMQFKNWSKYEDAFPNKKLIKFRAVTSKTMPPPGVPGLSDKDIENLNQWLDM